MSDRLESKIDKLIEKIDSKFDKVENRLDSLDVTLVKQEANLREQMKRSDSFDKHVSILESKIVPIGTHVDRVQFLTKVAKFIGVPALISGIIAMIQFYTGK